MTSNATLRNWTVDTLTRRHRDPEALAPSIEPPSAPNADVPVHREPSLSTQLPSWPTCKPTISASRPDAGRTNYISVSHGIDNLLPHPTQTVTSLAKSHYGHPCAPYVLRNRLKMFSLLGTARPKPHGPAGPVPLASPPPSLLRCGPLGFGAGPSSGQRRTTRCRSGGRTNRCRENAEPNASSGWLPPRRLPNKSHNETPSLSSPTIPAHKVLVIQMLTQPLKSW